MLGPWYAELSEITVVVTLLVLALVVVAVYARRRYIARGSALLVCAERPAGATGWRPRLARYDVASLELFSLGGLGVQPLRSVPRGINGLLGVSDLPRAEWPPLMDEPVVLRCQADGEPFELAISRHQYTAVRAWLESSPPGIAHPAS